jgi:hypothetical protein
MGEAEERAARAVARRARVTIARVPEDETDFDVLPPIRGAEGVALAWRLTMAAWGISGADLRPTPRAQLMVRFVPDKEP